MAERKYYWLKLKNDFFATKEMKKLRKIAGGDTYTIIYLKLQLLSLKDEGKLYYDGIEESFADELALTIDEDADNVKATLFFLQKCGLAEIGDSDLLLCNVPECIGSETGAAQRMRDHRNRVTGERNKIEQSSNKVQKRYTEIEKEKEKDIDIETEKRRKPSPVAAVEAVISDSGLTDEVKDAFRDFAESRRQMRAPLTEKAAKLLIGKLIKMTDSTEERIAIINQSVENGWKGFFELKRDRQDSQTKGEREQQKTVDMLKKFMEGDDEPSGIF